MCLLLAQLKIGFFFSFFAAAVNSTNEANKAGLKQSIFLDVYALNLLSMRANQLPSSATRWQHGSQICFGIFCLVKNHKIDNNSTTTTAKDKIRTDLESLEL